MHIRAPSGDNEFVQAPAAYISRLRPLAPMNESCGSWSRTEHGACTKAAMRLSVAAAVSAVDDAIGDVVTSLRRAGMYRQSLIVLSTDNGGPTDGADHNNANNFPLRGCKGGYFDGGMRGVGLIHGIGLHARGVVSEAMHHVNDWMLTLLGAAKAGASGEMAAGSVVVEGPGVLEGPGVVEAPYRETAGGSAGGALADAPSAGHVLELGPTEPPLLMGDGVDNWAVFSRGSPSNRDEMIHVTQAAGSVLEAEAIRVGPLKLLWHPAGTDCSVTHAGWYPPPLQKWDYASFTVKCEEPPATAFECTAAAPCLFNISADPCEHRNLALAMPRAVETLKARLSQYRATAVLPWLNFENHDPRADPRHFGPLGEYGGLIAPWLTEAQAAAFYPTNYTGPGGGAGGAW